MPPRLYMRQVLQLGCLAVLLFYQNCSQAPDSAMNDNTASSFQEGLPFAYIEKPDTIAYMSCSEIKDPVKKSAYFSYRVGAYNNATGGLGMTDAFRASTQYYSTEDRAKVLSASTLNSNTILTLSIRLRSNLQSVWAQGNLSVGDEVDSLLPALDSADVAGPFAGLAKWNSGTMINYFPGPGSKRLMEASLRFYEFENISKDTRSNLEGSGNPAYLVVGYNDIADEMETKLRVPGGAGAQRAYGTGYSMSFSLPAGLSAGERRVISTTGLQEIDLQTGQVRPGNWDCAANYEFMVVRPEDLSRYPCNTTVDRFADVNQQAALNAVRRVLRVEDWFVDVANHCIVPKNSGDYCYGNTQGRTIQYGVNCSNAGATMCPHFVSVCIRR